MAVLEGFRVNMGTWGGDERALSRVIYNNELRYRILIQVGENCNTPFLGVVLFIYLFFNFVDVGCTRFVVC